MAATLSVQELSGSGGTASNVTAVRFRADGGSAVDVLSPITLPSDVRATLTADLTGSTSAQNFTVTAVSGVFSSGDYAIIEPGSERQEVVEITDTDTPSVGNLTALVRRNHAKGSVLYLVTAAKSKIFRLNITEAPASGIANIRFHRPDALPYGVFDQYRTVSSYSEGTATPFVSDATHVFSPVPLNPILVQAGPITSTGPVTTLVEVQWLFTARVVDADLTESARLETLQISPCAYRWQWGES